jgi:hypothetical protein
VETPPPDPAALLAIWMEWERGETTPGKALADLKRGGMRQLLEDGVLVEAAEAEGAGEIEGVGEGR